MSIGVIYTELDIDTSKFVKKQENLLRDIKQVGTDIELSLQRSFSNLGVQSDAIYQLMANKAIKSYERIAVSAQKSADEQFRAQSAMVAKINTLNQQMTANPLYETLGIKSQAAFKAQEAAIMASYNTIKNSGTATAQDLINIEHAKNRKLKELNKEMVGDHEMSMASMTRAVLRFYAAFYVISTAGQFIGNLFMGGVKAIDDLKTSTIAVAAQITSMQGTTGNVVENYRQNVIYAEALNKKLMEVDANSFANYEQIQLMNRAMINQGVILDINKQKQVESFTALTNAVALFTTGQDKAKQASQEIRSLFTGQIRPGDMVAMQMDALIKKEGIYADGLKGLIKLGKEHGDTLERMQPYLVGIMAASGDISKTWEAVGSSLQTAWGIMQRSLFKDFYKTLVDDGAEFVKWIKTNADEVSMYIRIGFNAVSNIIMSIWNVLKGFAPLAKDFGFAVAGVAYGWGGVFAVMKPIGEFLGNSIALTYNLVKMLGNAALAIGALATGQTGVAKTAWDEAKKNWSEVEQLSIKNRKILVDGIADSVVAYDKQFNAAKKASGGYIGTPKVGAGASTETDPAKAKSAHKEAMDLLAEETAKIKEHYEDSIAKANEWAATQRENGANEWTVIQDLYDKKTDYLVEYYFNEAKEVNESNLRATEKAKKIAQLDREVTKEYNKDLKEKGDSERKAAQKYIAVMASVYKTLDQYSQDSIDSELKSIARKYDAEYALAKSEEDREAIRRAWEKESSDFVLNLKIKELDEQANYYSTITGYEDTYREKKLEWIEKTRQAEIAAGKDVAAANKKAADAEGKLAQDLFEKKTQYISQGFGDLSTAFSGISSLYDDGSDAAKRWQEASNAMLVAQKAVAVVNAVATIANQGLGDPYTAFARIAAMAAAMGALLSQIGCSVNGGSGGHSSSHSQSTVLGAEKGVGSESLNKSYELLKDTYDLESVRLTEIRNQLQNININIASASTSIIKTGGSWQFRPNTGDYRTDYAALYDENVGIGIGSTTIGSMASRGADVTRLSNPTPLDSRIIDAINSPLISLAKIIETSAMSFGLNVDEIRKKVIDSFKIYIRPNMTDAEVEKQIKTTLSNFSDTLFKDVFGDTVTSLLLEYQKLDEGLAETAIRLVQRNEVIAGYLDKIGQSLNIATPELIAFSESLINAAGDLSTLTDAWNVYFDKFFSDEEKQTYLQKSLSETMKSIGESMPDSREGFRHLLEGIDKIADPEKYYAVLKLAGSFDELFSAVDDSIEAAKQAAQEALDLAKSDLQKAFEAAKTTITANYNTQLTYLNKNLADLTANVNKLKAARERMNLVDAEAERITFIRSKQALMKGIYNDDILNSVSSISPESYSSSVDYHRDYGRIYNQLTLLEAEAQGKVSDAQRQIDILTKSYNFQIESMDKQYNALVGINDSVLSIAEAIRNYQNASNGTGTAATKWVVGSSGHQFDSVGQHVYNRNNAADMAEWNSGTVVGGRLCAWGTGTDNAYGWGIAGDNGAELINFGGGSKVYNSKDTKSILNTEKLEAKVAELLAEVKKGNTYQKKTADTVDKWEYVGVPITWYDSVDSVRP